MKRSTFHLSPYLKKPKTSHAGKKLLEEYYNKNCLDLAKSLLGKLIVRHMNGQRLTCMIVEVESYFASDDKSSHSYNHKKTKRNEAMFMKPGTLYVYMTYGMYNCMNISSKGNFQSNSEFK